MIRVLVVDDSAFVRKALVRILQSDPEIVVCGTAADGEEALRAARELRPDVVTLDVQMPRLDGLAALEKMIEARPVPVLLLSSLTREGADVTLRGLELGAMDFVDKSRVRGQMNLLELSAEIQGKIRALAGASTAHMHQLRSARDKPLAVPTSKARRLDAVVIAASTGGPTALQAVIPRLPVGLDIAVMVVQHIPVGFTRTLAQRLDERSPLTVREATDGELVQAGQVLFAPAGIHMKLRRRGQRVRVSLEEQPEDSLHRPSADVLMAAAARVYGPRCLGVVLTGMGADGTEGLSRIRAAGGPTLAEDESTAVIYGMPKSAVEAGVVDRSVPLGSMASAILAAL